VFPHKLPKFRISRIVQVVVTHQKYINCFFQVVKTSTHYKTKQNKRMTPTVEEKLEQIDNTLKSIERTLETHHHNTMLISTIQTATLMIGFVLLPWLL